MQKYALKFRNKCGFVESDLEEVLNDPHLAVVDIFMNRAVLIESSDSIDQLMESLGEKWIIAPETTYILPYGNPLGN